MVLCFGYFNAKQNPHPTGGVMLGGYAGPGWVWPKAVHCSLWTRLQCHCEDRVMTCWTVLVLKKVGII